MLQKPKGYLPCVKIVCCCCLVSFLPFSTIKTPAACSLPPSSSQTLPHLRCLFARDSLCKGAEEVLFDSTSKQYEVTTKKVTAILCYINKNTVSRSYTTDLTYQIIRQYGFQLLAPYLERNLVQGQHINRLRTRWVRKPEQSIWLETIMASCSNSFKKRNMAAKIK